MVDPFFFLEFYIDPPHFFNELYNIVLYIFLSNGYNQLQWLPWEENCVILEEGERFPLYCILLYMF